MVPCVLYKTRNLNGHPLPCMRSAMEMSVWNGYERHGQTGNDSTAVTAGSNKLTAHSTGRQTV
jgi:hypothetical protein